MNVPELVDRIGLVHYHNLKKMSKSAGVQFLKQFMLLSEEEQFALTCCKGIQQDIPGKRSVTVVSHRRAVMWICGASLRQMAFLENVSSGAIQQSIRKHLSDQQRRAYNTRTVQVLTPSQVSAYDAAYRANEIELSQMAAIEAADKIQEYVREYLDD